MGLNRNESGCGVAESKCRKKPLDIYWFSRRCASVPSRSCSPENCNILGCILIRNGWGVQGGCSCNATVMINDVCVRFIWEARIKPPNDSHYVKKLSKQNCNYWSAGVKFCDHTGIVIITIKMVKLTLFY